MKNLRYACEAVFLKLAFAVFSMLQPHTASALGGWLGRFIGTRLAASRKARANLKMAMPEKSPEEIEKIIEGMWDNLGRVAAEYPHLKNIIMNRVEIVGEEHLQAIGKDSPCVIIGGHLANWELLPFYFNYKIDWPVSGIYREPNNPYAGKILDRARNPEDRGTYIPKSAKGAREIVNTLRSGERLAVLIDQKYNEGIAADFFGHPAMTSTAFAQLAGKYDCPIVPFQVERLPDCRFRLTIHSPFKTQGRAEAEIVDVAHEMLEGWISKNPEQWLWLHRRWKNRDA